MIKFLTVSLGKYYSFMRMFVGAIAVLSDFFNEGNLERVITNLGCSGTEANLLDCPHSSFSGFDCAASGAVCQCEHVIVA